jgi:ATP-binding cassette subfamily C protein
MGSCHSLANNEGILLKDSDVLFLPPGESVNIFAHRKDREEVRHFICKMEEGWIFPSFIVSKDISYEMIAVSEGATSLYVIRQSSLIQEIEKNKDAIEAWSLAIKTWIQKITTFLPWPSFNVQIIDARLPSPNILAGETFYITKPSEVLFFQLSQGSICYMAHDQFSLTTSAQILPISDKIFIESKVSSSCTFYSLRELIENKLLSQAMYDFASFYGTLFHEHIEKQEEISNQLYAKKKEEGELLFSFALKKLSSLFSFHLPKVMVQRRDPLEASLDHIGQFFNIDFLFPKKTDKEITIEDRIDEICKLTHIRKRKIELSSSWWKKDHGPLLCFDATTGEPKAVINSNYLKYYQIDPSSGQKKKINQQLAQKLSLNAYMFYPSFDETIRSGPDILKYFMKNSFRQLIPLFLFSIIGTLISFFPAIATQFLFNFAIPQHSPSLILYLTLGLIYSALGFSFFYFLRNLYFLRLEGISIHNIQCAIWDRILKLPASFFRRFTIGNLLWRIMSIEEVRNLVSGNTANLLLNGAFSLLMLLLMFTYSPSLTLIVFIATVASFGITSYCCVKKISFLKKSFECQGMIRGLLIQIISGVGKLRVASAEKSAFSHWASIFSESKFFQMKALQMQNIVNTTSTLIPLLSTWVIYVALFYWIGIDNLSLPDFLAFNVAYGSYSLAIFPIASLIFEMIDFVPLWERTKVILQEPLEEVSNKSSAGKLQGEIHVDGVVFGYDPHLPPILNNVSMKIHPGQFVAIVGASGCGKSTLIRLILGFEKPQVGAIYFDGKDFSSLDPQSVRKQLGVVFQREGIMAGSIYDNLVCGSTYSIEQILEALRLSEFANDVENFPMGLHTIVPMNGETLSGGQKQRLLLARALLAHPTILIFDEATSALDNKSQAKVSDNIAHLHTTRIVIAQRLSTIKEADIIYVMDQGKVVQEGRFDELSHSPGLFADMLKRQKL